MPYLEACWFGIDTGGELAVFNYDQEFCPRDIKLSFAGAAVEDLLLDVLPKNSAFDLDEQIGALQVQWFRRFPNPAELRCLSDQLMHDTYGEYAARGIWVYAALTKPRSVSVLYQRVCIPAQPLRQTSLPPALAEQLHPARILPVSFSKSHSVVVTHDGEEH